MWDYVVVGAGSAGCVLAARLSEDPTIKVLLLEAGGSDADPRVRIPGLVGLLWRNRFDWTYHTTPQTELGRRRVHWPRGKVLGGSSSLNYMVYIRGHRQNYDDWRDLGNPGWGYDDVLPYFKRSEGNARGASQFHGAEGPLTVSDVAPNPMSELLLEAARDALGAPLNADFNGAEQEGVGRYQHTIRDGERCSTAVAFLRPALTRPNLTVETDAMALGVMVERGRAVGVRYAVGSELREARAAREVVLSGGAIGSPQLLLLSGIGPATELRAVGVDVVHDLPGVGKNLQDHPITGAAFRERGGLTGNVNPLSLLGWLGRHLLTRRGPLASSGTETGGFVRSRAGAPIPDLQLHNLPLGSEQVNFDEEAFTPKGHAFTTVPVLLYPKSRGEVRLTSTDPRIHPAIDPRYFSEPADLELMLEGQRMAQAITRSRLLDACRGPALHPASELEDARLLRAEIRRRVTTLFHPVGTCKMGVDTLAVVDPELRVRGVEGLRVIDASIMPTIVGGNTNAPTIMIAEKGADLLRGHR